MNRTLLFDLRSMSDLLRMGVVNNVRLCLSIYPPGHICSLYVSRFFVWTFPLCLLCRQFPYCKVQVYKFHCNFCWGKKILLAIRSYTLEFVTYSPNEEVYKFDTFFLVIVKNCLRLMTIVDCFQSTSIH